MSKKLPRIPIKNTLYLLLLLIGITSCRKDDIVVPAEYDGIAPPELDSPLLGFYLVNEGNMGSNKCTIDFFDISSGYYTRNLYPERNPNAIKELGDVGNDIAIYGSKLYVVVNCSHKVEVMNAYTGIRIGQIDIPNCRYVRFYNGKGYVSSYVSPVTVDPDSPKGAVFEIDTTSLKITRQVTVGYQPEEMAVIDDKMYVANSGGYRAPDYDNTLSVIDLKEFRQIRRIPVAINLHRVRADHRDKLWVSSRGNNTDIPSRLYILEKSAESDRMEVAEEIDVACSEMAMHGDSLLFFASDWSDTGQSNKVSYGIIDMKTRKQISENFITDGTEREITRPYGLAVNPVNGDIYVTDAKNYVSSGTLYCFSSEGKKKWSVRTGDIPSHIAFLYKAK